MTSIDQSEASIEGNMSLGQSLSSSQYSAFDKYLMHKELNLQEVAVKKLKHISYSTAQIHAVSELIFIHI